jgi:hypothetical protein
MITGTLLTRISCRGLAKLSGVVMQAAAGMRACRTGPSGTGGKSPELEALRVLKELPRDALDGSWSELRDSRSKQGAPHHGLKTRELKLTKLQGSTCSHLGLAHPPFVTIDIPCMQHV